MDEQTEPLDALTRQAGRWLARSAAPAERHTTAVVAGPYDRVARRDVYARSAALRELATRLLTRHAYAPDLLADVFLCAYQAAPRLRDRAVTAPSHLVHHPVVAALTQSPDFAALHRETAGDAYAAALAALAQSSALRGLLERSREARERTGRAGQARQRAEAAAADVGEALRKAAAEAGGQGEAPAPAVAAVRRAVEAAEAAENEARREDGAAAQAMAAAVPGIRSAARAAASAAAEAVRQEAGLMRAWGVEAGERERMPFDERARLAERLRSGRLAAWADLIPGLRRDLPRRRHGFPAPAGHGREDPGGGVRRRVPGARRHRPDHRRRLRGLGELDAPVERRQTPPGLPPLRHRHRHPRHRHRLGFGPGVPLRQPPHDRRPDGRPHDGGPVPGDQTRSDHASGRDSRTPRSGRNRGVRRSRHVREPLGGPCRRGRGGTGAAGSRRGGREGRRRDRYPALRCAGPRRCVPRPAVA